MDICKNCGNEIKPAAKAGYWHHVGLAEPWSDQGICGRAEPFGPLTEEDLTRIESHIDDLDYTGNDVLRLVAEIRRQRTVLDQIDTASQRLEAGVNHIAAQSGELREALHYLDVIIQAYAADDRDLLFVACHLAKQWRNPEED